MSSYQRFTHLLIFLLTYLFSKADSSVRAGRGIGTFEDQYVRGPTGYGAVSASNY